MLEVVLALAAASQEGGAGATYPFERRLGVSQSISITGDAGGCVRRQDNRRFVTEQLRALGLTRGPRSEESAEALVIVTEPQRQLDRIAYHYLSIGSALCTPFDRPNYPCLSVYAARIEAPVGPDGAPLPGRALNDPDRTTVALLDLARAVAVRCGHVAGSDD